MNGPYTLDQVKASGLPAHWSGAEHNISVRFSYEGGRLWATWKMPTGISYVGPLTLTVPLFDWMHSDGCTCDLCRGGG
jgi:hypothetical protein